MRTHDFAIFENGREVGSARGLNAKKALDAWFGANDLTTEDDETPQQATVEFTDSRFTAIWKGAA